MTPEEKSLLERTLKLAEENNKILLSMRRMARFSTLFKILYWVIIIGLAVGAFYLIDPYLKAMMSQLEDLRGGLQQYGNETDSIKTLMDLLPG